MAIAGWSRAGGDVLASHLLFDGLAMIAGFPGAAPVNGGLGTIHLGFQQDGTSLRLRTILEVSNHFLPCNHAPLTDVAINHGIRRLTRRKIKKVLSMIKL